jgi:cellobiose phosphorylase
MPDDKVGRIIYLPEGTAENASTYNHSTCFAIWSLFEIDEGEKAWKTLYKLLPFNHEFITTTPFVMPNSFSYNPDKGFDGESMSDWFTGAGCVLLKLLIHGMFGVKTSLEGVKIKPVSYMPFKEAELSVKIKNKFFRIRYSKKDIGVREYKVNGKVYQQEEIFLVDDALTEEMLIEIID